MTRRTAAALALTLVSWATAFVAIRAALHAYSPAHLALGRFVIASSILAIVAVRNRTRLPERRDVPRLLLVGLLGITAYNLAVNYGELGVTAGSASFIINTVPIITTLFAVALLGDRLSVPGVLGMAISFAGVSLVAIGESGGPRFGLGTAVLVGAAVLQSLYFVLQKPLLAKYRALDVVSYAVWIGTVSLLPALPGLGQEIREASATASAALLFLGIFSSTVAYACWSYVLATMPASRAVSYLYVVPVLVLGIGYLWLREIPAPLSLLGGGAALSGVLVANVLGKRRRPDPLPAGGGA